MNIFSKYLKEFEPSVKDSDNDILEELGEYSVRNGKLYWRPPIGLNIIVRHAIQKSIRELNRLITSGVVKCEQDGEIRLVKKKGSNQGGN